MNNCPNYMQTMSLNQLGMDGISSKQAPVVVIVASSTGKLVEGLHIGMIERALRRLKVYIENFEKPVRQCSIAAQKLVPVISKPSQAPSWSKHLSHSAQMSIRHD
jgi:hypothetical protein